MQKTGLIVAVILMVSGFVWPLMAQAAQTRPARELDNLWFGVRISLTLAGWFNKVARLPAQAQQLERGRPKTAGSPLRAAGVS